MKRTKKEIAKDVSQVIKSNLHEQTKKVVLDNAFWCWSGFEGKYGGCKYWSRDAWAMRNDRKALRHEHLIPKKVLIKIILEKDLGNALNIYNFFDQFCIGVVVSKEQDRLLTLKGLRSSMPKDWDGIDPWARYRKSGIFDQIIEPNNTSKRTASTRSA